jgi:hypothetical protein
MIAPMNSPFLPDMPWFVRQLFDAARIGVRQLWRGRADSNAPTGATTTLLNRLARILRYTLVIAATLTDIAPARQRSPRPGRARQLFRLRRPTLRIFTRHVARDAAAPASAQPLVFQTPRDPYLIAQRKLEALTRALDDSARIVRRIARRLPTQLTVLVWRPPKRPPPTLQRDWWDELITAWAELRHRLTAHHRRMRTIEQGAPA